MVKIRYPKYYKELSLSDLKKECVKKFDDKLNGKKIINGPSGAEITLSKKGVKHALFARHSSFQKTICTLKIDQIIRHGKMYCIEKGKGKGILFIIKFLTKIQIDNEILYVVSFVRGTNQGKMYYDHALLEKKKPQDYRNG